MAHHARVEELSETDSDPSEMDISEFDPSKEASRGHQLAPATNNAQAGFRARPTGPQSSLINPSAIPSSSTGAPANFQSASATDIEKYAKFQCIYPVYFDRNRTRAEGRRVGLEKAVFNPLAREIVNAVGKLG